MRRTIPWQKRFQNEKVLGDGGVAKEEGSLSVEITSKVRTITFNSSPATKTTKGAGAGAPPPPRGSSKEELAALVAKLESKSERDLTKLLVPELTEMLHTLGEVYTPPKHECVALLIRRAAEEKARAKTE